MEPIVDETLVSFGSEIKMISEDAAAGTMEFGAWLVMFGSPQQTDASPLRDYFTKSTDFDIEDGDKTTVYYNHGLDGTMKRRKLGAATLHIKDAGIWMQGQLQARDEYEAKVQEMVRAGKLGASSGVPAHLVERKAVGNAHEILLWPLGKDASLTPTPAEPRTMCMSLKSLVEGEEAADALDAVAQNTAQSAAIAKLVAIGATYAAEDAALKAMAHDAEAKSATPSLEILEAGLHVGLALKDHSAKVLAANEEYMERIDAWFDTRSASRKSGRVLSADNHEFFSGHSSQLRAMADALDEKLELHRPVSSDEAAKSLDTEIEDLEIGFLEQETRLNALFNPI